MITLPARKLFKNKEIRFCSQQMIAALLKTLARPLLLTQRYVRPWREHSTATLERLTKLGVMMYCKFLEISLRGAAYKYQCNISV